MDIIGVGSATFLNITLTMRCLKAMYMLFLLIAPGIVGSAANAITRQQNGQVIHIESDEQIIHD